jgi:hypothetical protein
MIVVTVTFTCRLIVRIDSIHSWYGDFFSTFFVQYSYCLSIKTMLITSYTGSTFLTLTMIITQPLHYYSAGVFPFYGFICLLQFLQFWLYCLIQVYFCCYTRRYLLYGRPMAQKSLDTPFLLPISSVK